MVFVELEKKVESLDARVTYLEKEMNAMKRVFMQLVPLFSNNLREIADLRKELRHELEAIKRHQRPHRTRQHHHRHEH